MNAQAKKIALELDNADGLVEAGRELLEKLIYAHVLVRSCSHDGSGDVNLKEDQAVCDFFDNAASLAGHLQCFATYFDEIRRTAGIVIATDEALSTAAEE